MRISNLMQRNFFIRQLQKNSSELTRVTQQIASSRRINKPSDDPNRISQALRLRSSLIALNQYGANGNDTLTLLKTSEAALGSLTSELRSARGIAVRAANSTVSSEARQVLANQVDQIINRVAQLLNSDSAGRFVFGGTNDSSQPITPTNGALVFTALNGNLEVAVAGVNGGIPVTLQITPASYTDVNALATEIQTQIDASALAGGVTVSVVSGALTFSSTGTGPTESVTVSEPAQSSALLSLGFLASTQNAAGSQISAQPATLTAATPPTGLTVTGSDNTFNLAVAGVNGGLPVQLQIPPATYATVQDLANAIQTEIDGSLLTGSVTASVINGSITFTTTTTGATASVTITDGASNDARALLGFATSGDSATGADVIDVAAALTAGSEPPTSAYSYGGTGVRLRQAVAPNVLLDSTVTGAEVLNARVEDGEILDLIRTLQTLATALRTDDLETVSNRIGSIDAEIANTGRLRADLGARIQYVELTQDRIEDEILTVRGHLSGIEDTDLAHAAIELAGARQAQEAALAMAASLGRLSLIDFLR